MQLKTLCITASVLLFQSCTTTETQRLEPLAISQSEFDKLNVKQPDKHSFFSDMMKEGTVNGKAQRPDVLPTIFTEKQATDIFKDLCKGGKPVKKIESQFDFVIPKPPSGLPLDKAQAMTDGIKRLGRVFVGNYFRLTTDYYQYYRYYQLNKMYSAVPGLPLILTGKKSQKLNDHLKNLEISVSSRYFQGGDPLEPLQKFLQVYNAVAYNAADGMGISPVPLFLWDESKKQVFLATLINPDQFYVDQVKELKHRKDSKSHRPMMVEAPEKLVEIMPVDLLAIKEHYVLLASNEEADAWFRVADARNSGRLEAEIPADMKPGDKPLKQSQLLQDGNWIFTNYLISNVAITESATNDGQILAFKLALNTEPLCRLGRLRNQLTSK